MSTKTNKSEQAERFRVRAKKALVGRDMSVTALAALLGHPRNTVSMAINRSCFPRVVEKVKSELSLS